MSSDFDPIAAEFRDIFIDLGTRHLSVLALPQDPWGGDFDLDSHVDPQSDPSIPAWQNSGEILGYSAPNVGRIHR
jgi:hypothetical protein